MAKEPIITATKEAVTGEATEFTVSGPFWLFGDGFQFTERAVLMRPNNAGDGYVEATNEKGRMAVSQYPNIAYCEVPAGTYRIDKSATDQLTSVSYEVG